MEPWASRVSVTRRAVLRSNFGESRKAHPVGLRKDEEQVKQPSFISV